MSREVIDKFQKMGARLILRSHVSRVRTSQWSLVGRPAPQIETAPSITVDIRNTPEGEVFVVSLREGSTVDLQVTNLDKEDRHLVLASRVLDDHGNASDKHHFLCGHDERHWFVAEVQNASTVTKAKDSLKPREILDQQVGKNVEKRNKRHNEVYKRQGEWFFVPADDLAVDTKLIRRNEPLRRNSRSKAHTAEYAYRLGGRDVWVQGRNIIDPPAYEALQKKDPKEAGYYRLMKADATVYVKGKITHADHATILLDGWHRVIMNTEKASERVIFLD